MIQTLSIRQKINQFLHILFPILITQIALSAITFFDTNMSGKFGTADLAGVAIGTSLWIPIQTGLSGILIGITPIVSHLLGSKREKEVAYQVMQGLWLSIIVSVFVLFIGFLCLSYSRFHEFRASCKRYCLSLSGCYILRCNSIVRIYRPSQLH